jgi:voltage-gated potassium channel
MRAVQVSVIQWVRLVYRRSIMIRLMFYCLLGLLTVSVALHLVEKTWGGDESEYKSYPQTLVNILILFTSGFDAGVPVTVGGKIMAFTALGLGLCFVGMFTAEIAAWLVERRLKGARGMKEVQVNDHIIITRWSKDTEAIIDELMSEEIKERRNVVVIDKDIDELPVTNPYVSFVKGDATEEEVLRRAGVMKARTAIILADPSAADYNAEDSHTILVGLAIESINPKVYTVVQVLNPSNIKHLERADCDEIICTTEISTRIVVQSSINHGLSRMFSSVLSFGEGSEIYRVKLARRFAGKEYFELGSELASRHRISLLGLQSGDTLTINPQQTKVRVQEGDHAFVLSDEHPSQIED